MSLKEQLRKTLSRHDYNVSTILSKASGSELIDLVTDCLIQNHQVVRQIFVRSISTFERFDKHDWKQVVSNVRPAPPFGLSQFTQSVVGLCYVDAEYLQSIGLTKQETDELVHGTQSDQYIHRHPIENVPLDWLACKMNVHKTKWYRSVGLSDWDIFRLFRLFTDRWSDIQEGDELAQWWSLDWLTQQVQRGRQ